MKEAEERLLRKDYLAALVSLESAWHLQPNDPAIIEMQQRIQIAQQQEIAANQESKLTEAELLLSQGHDEQAFSIAVEILVDDPSHKAAKALRDQILDNRWEQVQKQIKSDLELAIQPLSFCDFEVSLELLSNLQKTLEIESCRKEVDRLRLAVVALGSAFLKEQYYDIPHILKKLLSKDPFGWLEAHRQVFAEIQTVAEERFSLRKKMLLECRNLWRSGQTREAITRINSMIKPGSMPEADELRSEILNSFHETKIREAHAFAVQLNWEDAIDCWTEILQYFPDEKEIQQFISNAEQHLRAELQVQQELLKELKHCYSLILKEHWVEAQELVERMLKSIQPGFRLIETEKQLEALQGEILLHNQEQQKRIAAHMRELAAVRKLHKRGLYAEALQKISLILEEDHVQEEAVDLKIAIEKAIQGEAVATRFQSAVQKGKAYFEQRNWQKAIEFWRKASSLSDETYVKEWIEQAEQQLKKERHTRLSIIAMLAEAEELIFYNKFSDAGRRLDKCRKALAGKFPMEDLAEQVRKVSARLDEAVRKDEMLRATTQSELEEASLLFHQKHFQQALFRVDAILQQQPEMESAILLKAQIESEEEKNRTILEMIRAAIKLVVKRDFKQLPALLSRLKEISAATPYEEDCKSIMDELPMLVLEIESGDQVGANQRLDRIFSRSLLLLEYEPTLRDFVDSLEIRNRKEKELENALETGLDCLEAGDRKGAIQCLERFREIFGGTQQKRILQGGDPLDRTATLSEDDLKLTDFEVEKLQQSLLNHEIETLLVAARDCMRQGDEPRAAKLFHQVLELDPGNTTALEILEKLQS